MRRAHIIDHVAAPGCAKRLNGKDLALFHLSLILVLDEGDGFSAVDAIVVNIVSAEVPYCLDGEGFAANFDFPALHCFLDGGADIAYAYVDTCFLIGCQSLIWYEGTGRDTHLDPCIGGILHSSEEIVIRGFKGHGEGTVNNPAIYMHAKVHRHDVLLLQHDILLAWIRRVMCDLVIETDTSGKAHASLEGIARLQTSVA